MMFRFYKLPTRNKFHFGRETNTMWRIKRASLSGSREISRQGLMMSWGLVYLAKITRGATTSRSRSLEKFEVFKWERNTFSLTYRAKFPQIWSPVGKLTTRDVIFQLSFVQPSLKPVKAELSPSFNSRIWSWRNSVVRATIHTFQFQLNSLVMG